MSLNNLKPAPGSKFAKKRVGRGPGSGNGKTAGRGNKGAQSRSGYSYKRGFEGGQMPLHRRVPKRGFNNIFRTEYAVVNLDQLESAFEAGATVADLEEQIAALKAELAEAKAAAKAARKVADKAAADLDAAWMTRTAE